MKKKFSRRAFLQTTSLACFTLAVPKLASAALQKANDFTIGLIADLHHDIMHDGFERLQAFVTEMKKTSPDAIMQLGDFAYPDEKNKNVIDLFNNAHSTALHVIGNHDNDAGHSHQQCIDIWGIPATYYTKKVNGFSFIILNGNDKGSPTSKGGYPSYIGTEQKQWLKQQLAAIQNPIIIVCHQPLEGWAAIDNAAEIKSIISSAKDRVVLVLNGHTHIDMLAYVDDIPYLTINSASYFWVGEDYEHDSYSKEILQAHKWISKTCPYRDSLFTTLTINPKKLTIELKAKKSEWVGKTPAELGYKEPLITAGKEIVPFIRPRKLHVPASVAYIDSSI